MMSQLPTTRDDFETWLASIDEFLEEFRSEFSAVDQRRLDFSAESLDVVEAWILRTFSDTHAMLSSTESPRVNRAACYIGEVFRKTLGGRWDIYLDDPEFAFFGMPVVVGTYDPECPLSLATAAADRRTGTYLRTVLQNT